MKELRTEKKYAEDRELQTEDLKALVSAYKALVFELSGKEVPQNPKEQLLETVRAMFEKYDRLKSDGLAINVQAMVFGNIGEDSCIGDACTRNPETGEDEIFGFFLRGGQGYDWKEKGHFVQPISELETAFPEIYQSFVKIGGLLERHYTDVQEMEFVIEKNRLYMLNTADSRRTAAAALKTAVALEKEEIIDRKTALTRLTAVQIEEILTEIIRADGSSNLSEDFSTLMKWADEIRMLKVRVNADNPAEIECAVQFGAEGIGLYRTEKMFSAEECRNALKDLMFSLSEDKREQAASYLREYQKNEFKKIFEMIGDRPAAIRLIDSLPYGEDSSLPRYRGCRIAIAHPEIAKLQTEALITAAIELKRETGIETMPEIMIPMVGCEKEFASVKNMVAAAAGQCFENEGESIDYIIGPMIEVPRAALVADELARNAEFFSFGTNDLTQTTFGLYRNDDGIVIKEYQEKCIFEQDPFITIDKNGVGRLIRMAAELGKSARSNLKLGLCGEQAGDLESVEFCHQIGLHYISCPPEMIPIAKFAAACAAVRQETERGE